MHAGLYNWADSNKFYVRSGQIKTNTNRLLKLEIRISLYVEPAHNWIGPHLKVDLDPTWSILTGAVERSSRSCLIDPAWTRHDVMSWVQPGHARGRAEAEPYSESRWGARNLKRKKKTHERSQRIHKNSSKIRENVKSSENFFKKY